MSWTEISKCLSGLHPTLWICLGKGFSKENIKATLCQLGTQDLVCEAVTHLVELAQSVFPQARGRMLIKLSRMEVYRELFSVSQIRRRFPLLNYQRRKENFYEKLDTALQSGRMAFTHDAEEQLFCERVGNTPLRDEFRIFSKAYEAWLTEANYWDLPLLLSDAAIACQVNQEKNQKPLDALPEKIIYFNAFVQESRESFFWQSLSQWTKVEFRKSLYFGKTGSETGAIVRREQWHTLDDVCEKVAQELKTQDLKTNDGQSENYILISQSLEVRRSLDRALREKEILKGKNMDPLRFQWDERVKTFLLPLEILANNFDRQGVISYLRGYYFSKNPRETLYWIRELVHRGIRKGLQSYEGGSLKQLYLELQKLQSQAGLKPTCESAARFHLQFLRQAHQNCAAGSEAVAMIELISNVWGKFIEDFKLLDIQFTQAPWIYWYRRFRKRLLLSLGRFNLNSGAENQRRDSGALIYQFGQSLPLFIENQENLSRKLWVLGLNGQALTGGFEKEEGLSTGDGWWSISDREKLAAEFSVRSRRQMRNYSLELLKEWMMGFEEVILLDWSYEWDGQEREDHSGLEEGVYKGSHDRWLASASGPKSVRSRDVRIAGQIPNNINPIKSPPEIRVSFMDLYSRCHFLGLAFGVWNANDLQEPNVELWPEVRGSLLHECVQKWLSPTLIGDVEDLSVLRNSLMEEVLDSVWAKSRATGKIKGLLRGVSIEKHVKEKLLIILNKFKEKELEFRDGKKIKHLQLDDKKMRWNFADVTFVGTPDRVDYIELKTPSGDHHGVFIMDYKSSSHLPTGTELLNLGVRLQLPLYAVCATEFYKAGLLGLQYVSLNLDGSRGKGIFFNKFNGKSSEYLTHLTSRSKSLMEVDPDSALQSIHEKILAEVNQLKAGDFSAFPKLIRECTTCRASDLCGRRRWSDDLSATDT